MSKPSVAANSVNAALPSARGFSLRDVSELIGMSVAQVRGFVRAGIIDATLGMRGEYRLSFQQIVLLRTAKGLLDTKVSTRRARKALLKLKGDLAHEQSLSAVRIFAEGNDIVVRDDATLWNAESGQGHFDFSVRELAGQIAELAEASVVEAQQNDDMSGDDWYNLALDLEDVAAEQAEQAYRKSIALNDANADAHVKLGRLEQLKNDLESAAAHYQRALELQPDHELANYNLGTLFDDRHELDRAMRCYERAPNVADAHYNLARLFEIKGDEVSAMRHYRRYRQLDR